MLDLQHSDLIQILLLSDLLQIAVISDMGILMAYILGKYFYFLLIIYCK